MGREYIPLFLDFNESTQDLSDEECGRLVRAIIDYANGLDYEARLTGAEKIAFRFLKGAIDRNQAISDARAKAGSNRKKVEQEVSEESKPEQNETNKNKTEQNEANSLNNNNNNNENNNKNKNKNDSAGSARFQKPTVEEVRAYMLERGKGLTAQDAETFVDFYESKGWRIGNSPMKDWKASVRTWEQRHKPTYGGYQQPTKTVSAQQYEQRDYSGSEESMEEVLARLRGNQYQAS